MNCAVTGPGTDCSSRFGPVDWVAAALVAPASVLGGVLGARLAQRLDPRLLRFGVVLLGCGAGIRLLVA